MTSKSKKQLLILFALLGLLSISIFSQITQEPANGVVARTKKSNVLETSSPNEVLRIDLLANQARELAGVKRNIFQFASGASGGDVTVPQMPVPQTQPVLPETPAVPEVHYLGFYYEKETGLKLAALSNSGRILVGKVGQILGGKYQVLQIASDQVVLKLLPEGKVLHVPLGKQPATVVEGDDEQSLADDDEQENEEE